MSATDATIAETQPWTPAVLEELRITRFKSFRDAVLPLGDLTLVIGRNGSGKSNALEALETLALLTHVAILRLIAGGDEPWVLHELS